MSSERQAATVRGLVEEAKKRIVFLVICVVGLSYLMSLTSSSVWVNLPAATFLIIILRYLSLDFDMRRKAAACNSKTPLTNISYQNKPFEGPKVIVEKPDWRRKVNSPAVEDAIDQFVRHLVSEWVTNLWYSRITPDRQGPEELVQIMNGVLGEVSFRMRNINLIDLLTRDIIDLICTHLELFRSSNAKIEKQESGLLTFEHRDMQLKSILAAENKLHPALFSSESEHRVLQHLMEGLIAFTFRPDDLQCALFHYIVRELLSCAVVRPVLNLANPRFINEKIESLVISLNKANKGATSAQVALQSKQNGSSRISSGHFSPFLDPSVKGVELVQLKRDQPKNAAEKPVTNNVNGTLLAKDPLLSVDTQSSRSWSSLPPDTKTGDEKDTQCHPSGGEWGDMLDMISRRKTKALAPEHLENMWTKGRNYKKKEVTKQFIDSVSQNSSARISKVVDHSNVPCKQKDKEGVGKVNPDASAILSECNSKSTTDNLSPHTWNISSDSPVASCIEDDDCKLMPEEEVESGSSSSYITEDEETTSITGLNSPGTKIWDGKNNRNTSVPHIHHPLESFEGNKTRKAAKRHEHSQRSPRAKFEQKRSRLSSQKKHIWQEVERTSFLSGDGLDILNSSKRKVKQDDSSDDSEAEMLGRVLSGATASSSAPSIPVPESARLDFKASRSSLLADSFLKLRCEVLGANVVKSGSRTFAVYSISVTDVNNNSWSVKRRFRHFEELHRRLKEFPEYNLHLPPKHFLSTGLDVPVIQERCKLLDIYLKKLLQLPTISGSIEVWDFLSVDSQTYIFSNSITIIETLSVDLDDTAHEKSREVHNHVGNVTEPSSSIREHSNAESKESVLQMKHDVVPDGSRLNTEVLVLFPPKKPKKEFGKPFEDSGSDSENVAQKNISKTRNLVKTVKGSEGDGLQESSESFVDPAADPTLPPEWVPPNLSLPILDLIDVIFQLQEGGWIRRKAFWMVKQVLQLGMGDALDDWLIEKIQLLRRGSVVASGIKRLEQILWPDGIFITKHPKRQRHAPSGNPSQGSPKEDIQKLDEQQQEQAERRAKFVYELMIDDAPAAIVGLVGRKEYEQCAKDLYYFLQSSVCLKQLAFELLELLLVSAFPELDYVFRQLHEEKPKFGDFKPN